MSVEVKSLVEAIYERYSNNVGNSSGNKLEEVLCIAASPASSTDESTSSSSVMCGSPGSEDIDSSSCDSILSISTTTTSTLTPNEPATSSTSKPAPTTVNNPVDSSPTKLDKRRKRVFNKSNASGGKNNTNNKIMFYLPDAYNNSTAGTAARVTSTAAQARGGNGNSVKDVNNNSNIITSVSLVMSDMNIKQVGDLEKLEKVCKNVLELDVSKNQFDDWSEIGKILGSLDKLRLLNLSSNKLHGHLLQKEVQEEDDDQQAMSPQQSADMKDIENNSESDTSQSDNQEENMDIEIPASPLTRQPSLIQSHQLNTLILNSCHLPFSTLEILLSHLPNLAELHLASNQYTSIEFSHSFVHPSLRILYFNNNLLSDWSQVAKLGQAFSNLDQLVLSDNSHLASFSHVNNNELFGNLKLLIANRLSINEWSCLDELKKFPSLKHLRMQHVPLLSSLSDEEKYFLLVAHLHDGVESLNGGRITAEDRDQCERKYIRYFMDSETRPSRYYELEAKHGKLNKLADVNLDARKKVLVKIKFDKKHYYEKIDVRQTVGDFKKHLEKLIGHPASRFRLFYIDIEACSLAALGPEELKHANRCLYSFNIRDQDEFQIDLKPTPTTSYSGSSGNGASLNWVLNSPSHSSSSPSELNNMHHLHIHHYNSHLNNNSFYQYPPSGNRSTAKQNTGGGTTSTANKSSSKQLLQQLPGSIASSVSPRPTTKHHKLSNPSSSSSSSKTSHHHNQQQSSASTK